ncbi:MmgE/PrpD family protein [Paenibacillus thalictri]|uniref:MmgE/PrpD family protein n=1 Tax=Paenibacillus thalictri TaxID=2527873 RepID=A0A4Q9DLK4_9BACL|nr:MmgE/PrpD family protein [Paenibacillus thalictri]TBL75992.1 MmgE/PrpD family protein [Paenibacillus thalictri]
MSLSREIARMIINTRYEQLPAEVVSFAKLCILDWLGSALAGEKQQPAQILAAIAEDMGGSGQATLITGGTSSVWNAALVNGAASHIVELDDIHKASIIHAATVVIPAALAVAEWKRKSGRELIAAVVIGYDICYRIGEAVSPSHYYYWHNTATCGTFGAAAAAGYLLGLTEEELIQALGSAGTQAAGLWEFIEDGAMSKQLHPGKAAMNGVLAAQLAQRGFTGATRILEGRRGFFQAMSESADAMKVTEGLGQTYKITENSFKIHASCRHTHHAVDMILEMLQERDIRPETIESIAVKTYQVALNITDNPHPQTVYAAKFSLQFCTALAAVKRSAGLADFSKSALADPEVLALMRRVEVGVDPQIDAAYPEKWGAAIEVKLADGTRIAKQTDYPKGDPESPVTDELVDKFRKLTADRPAEAVERYVERTLHLEELAEAGLLLSEL